MLFLFSVNHKKLKNTLTSLLIIALILTPLLSLIKIQTVSAAETVLTPKWTKSGLGTNWEGGLVIGDVTGDGAEEIVFAGGTSIYVINGTNGNTIATYTNSRIYRYCQPQLYDVDGNGILDILVPLYYLPGLAVIKYTGSSTLSELWVQNVQGTSGSGSCMSKPVAGDINGDGYLEIYIATQDVAPAGGYDGTVTMLDHQGNILAQTFSWRSCSGGLSLADTDNDGEFELYMGDRGIYYGDGNYGKGTRSFWARNLTERWNRLDFLSSSQAPVLVDVNGDGVLEVLAGMYREMNILNSTNGATIQRWTDPAMSVHYGITVYDIDGDGHLELLCNDGDHDDDPYTDVFDLVTGKMDAQLSLAGGDSKWSPLVADISPNNPGMEIISVPNGTSLEPNYWNGAIMIFDKNYQSIQNITRDSNNARLGSQLGYPIVQDIDGDKLLELVTHASSGSIYVYDTSAPAPGYSSSLPGSQRIRSEVTFFGEKRNGVAQYEIPPWGTNYWTAPIVAPSYPGIDALGVPITTSKLSFRMREHQGQTVNYIVNSSPNIGGGSGSSVGNPYNWANYSVNINPGSLNYDTTYTWTVSATDGTNTTVKTYSFRTALVPAIGNVAPSQTSPLLTPQDGLGTTTSTFFCSNQTTTDPNGNSVTNTYRWLAHGTPVANLQLPFNLRNETSTKDYAYGNNGIVQGAVWTPNGIVGGAYSFDGQDDAIIISDGGLGYYNNKTYASNQPELGGGGNWTQITVEAWINLKQYNNGSRIVAKLPSYELGFQSGYTNYLTASVWPKTYGIGTDDNAASTDRPQTVTAAVDIQLNTWYHIAFTYKSGDGIRLYLNGVQVAQKTGIVGPLEDSLGEPIYIGRLVQPFNGLIDEVSMYPYAQSAQQINNSYQQTRSGSSSNSSFVPLGAAMPGDTLACQVIPTDSYAEGNMLSASVVLLNSPPSASNLVIYPLRDRALRLKTEDLVAGYNYTDPDGNPEVSSQIKWYMNGALQSSFNNQTRIPAANTQVGQTWYFTVTPRDSIGGLGVMQTSYTITIRDNIAPSTGTPTLVSSGGGTGLDDEDLIASAVGTSDANGDSTTNIYRWTKQGVSYANLQMLFDNEVPSYFNANATTRDYSGYGNNGTVVGASWVKSGVVGGALSFDGNDFVRVKENGNTLGKDGSWSEATVEFWVKANGTTSAEPVVMKHDYNFSSPSGYSSSGSSYGLGYRADFRAYANRDRFYWYVYNNTGVGSVEFSDYTNFGLWHHVVCTYKSGIGLKLYVDGQERASTPFTGNINATLDGILDIGGYGSGTVDFSGLLDEVRIYPKALSNAQIFQRYIETKDGLSGSNTIVAQETTAGDDWVCQVTPSDSWVDGTVKSSLSLHVNAVSGNSRPRIDWYSPANLTSTFTAGSNVTFMQVSSDPNSNPLSYSWTLDSAQQANTQNWTYTPSNTSLGSHKVRITVSDGALNDFQEWNVNVVNANTTYYNLAIAASSNGNTNPIAGTYSHPQNAQVSIQANPNSGYALSNWQLNNTNVGNANPYALTMDSNYTIAAVFQAVSVQYQLHVEISGSGSTNATGNNLHDNGTTVAVQATPASGWRFNYWLLNGTNVGSTNPYAITMNANYNCTAIFAQSAPYLFEDGFESGTFSKWNGTSVTSGETATVVDTLPHHGTYSSRFTTNGTGGTERAYSYVNFTGQNELYVREYFNIQSGLPLPANDDRFNLFALQNATTTIVSAGVRKTNGTDVWSITGVPGTWYASAGPSMNQWYCVELYIKIGAPNGALSLRVNGQLVIDQSQLNMSSPVNIVQLRSGLVFVSNSSISLSVYGDCVAISNEYIGLEQGQIQRQLIISTVGSGTTNPVAGTYTYSDGAGVSVQATPDAGWALSYWLLNGTNVGSANPYALTINANYNLTAVFQAVQYQLQVGVSGSGSTNATGTSLYNYGANVAVQATPASGWRFNYWLLNGANVGSVNPYSLTMNANYNCTAVFTQISSYMFEDGFESGTFSNWNGTIVTSGETVTVTNTLYHHGNYSANFITNGTGGTERAYSYVNFTGQSELYVRGYFNIQSGLPLQVNDDRFNFYALQNSSAATIASAGVRRINGADVWSITSVSGTWNATTGPALNQWYCIELYIKLGAAPDGTLIMWVNGQSVINQTGLNMTAPGSIVQLRSGISYAYNILTPLNVYSDCVAIHNSYIGPEDQVHNHQLTIYTVGSGTTNPTSGAHVYSEGASVTLQANASSGWTFTRWLLNGADIGNASQCQLTMSNDYNLTVVFTQVQMSLPNAILVVRGGDNAIYYRPYNTTSTVWGAWSTMPSGTTVGSPAATVCLGKIYTVVRGMDGTTLWFSSMTLEGNVFSGWSQLGGSTQSSPTLTNNGTHLILLVRGMDNVIRYRIFNIQQATWGAWFTLPGSTTDTISATVLGNQLHLVVRGETNNITLWHCYVNLLDNSFSGWDNVPGASDAAPTLVACPTQNSVELCVKGVNGIIYMNNWVNGAWQGWTALSSGVTIDSPAVTAVGDKLQFIVRGSDGYTLWQCSYGLSTHVQSQWVLVDGSTPSAPKLTS